MIHSDNVPYIPQQFYSTHISINASICWSEGKMTQNDWNASNSKENVVCSWNSDITEWNCGCVLPLLILMSYLWHLTFWRALRGRLKSYYYETPRIWPSPRLSSSYKDLFNLLNVLLHCRHAEGGGGHFKTVNWIPSLPDNSLGPNSSRFKGLLPICPLSMHLIPKASEHVKWPHFFLNVL